MFAQSTSILELPCTEKLENNSLIFQSLEEELKPDPKINIKEKIYSYQSTSTTDTHDFIVSKGTLEVENRFPDSISFDVLSMEEQLSNGLNLTETASLQILNTKGSDYNSENLKFHALENLKVCSKDDLGRAISNIGIQIDDSIYERAEKFLDSTKLFTFVIPGEENRPKKPIKLLAKHRSLQDDALNIISSPVLSRIPTSSLLIRRENSPEFKQNSDRFRLTISLEQSPSIRLNSIVVDDFENPAAKKEKEEEDKYYNDSEVRKHKDIENSTVQNQTLSRTSKPSTFSLDVIPGCQDSGNSSPQ